MFDNSCTVSTVSTVSTVLSKQLFTFLTTNFLYPLKLNLKNMQFMVSKKELKLKEIDKSYLSFIDLFLRLMV